MPEDKLQAIYDRAKKKIERLEEEQKMPAIAKYEFESNMTRIKHGDFCKIE